MASRSDSGILPDENFLPNAEARNPATSRPLSQIRTRGAADRIRRRRHAKAPVLLRICALPSAVVAPLTAPALAFAGAGSREEIELAQGLRREHGQGWVARWLRARGFSDWARYFEELSQPT